MIKKSVFILLFSFIVQLIASCCNCVETTILHYTNKTFVTYNLDNSGAQPIVSTGTSIIKSAYGIRIELLREKTASLQKPTFLSFQSAYAVDCFCPPPIEIMPKDSVVSIRIITVNTFDNTHAAGADISGYFKVYEQHSFVSISDYLKRSAPVLLQDSELKVQVDFLLMSPPSSGSQQKFKVQLILSDGRMIEHETAAIQLV